MTYLIQVNLYLILFYGFYRLILRNETFHQLNRSYLVVSAVLSFGIPFWYSDYVQSWFVTQQINEVIYTTILSESWVMVRAVAPKSGLTWMDLLRFVYTIGSIAFAVRLIIILSQLILVLKRKQLEKFEAFSFFGYSFVADTIQKRETILAHEHVHVQQLHSIDVMIFELIAILNWFNPIVYLYKKDVKHIHEFIADEIASTRESSKADYAMLLFSREFGVLNPSTLIQPFFNHSTLKRRIFMLQQTKSKQTALLKYGLVLPLFILMLIFSSAWITKNEEIGKVEEVVNENIFVAKENAPKVIINGNKSFKTIRGRVLAYNDKTPLFGVDVMTEDGQLGTVTDFDGNFILPKVVEGARIKFSLFGFAESLIIVKDKEDFEVIMRENTDKTSDVRTLKMIGKLIDANGNPVANYLVNLANGNRRVGFCTSNEKGEFSFDKVSLTDRLVILDSKEESVFQYKPFQAGGLNPNDKLEYYGNTVKYQITIDKSKAVSTSREVNDSDEVFTSVEQVPEFEGGNTNALKYIAKNIRYPKEAQRKNIQGKVFIKFIVEKDGSVSNPTILKGIGEGCDDEAKKVIESMPKWKPGKQNGQPVRVWFTIPISFTLEGDEIQPPIQNKLEEIVVTGYSMPYSPQKVNPILDIRSGNKPSLNLRGMNGIEDALIVVDGIIQKDLQNINPNDIASVSVLKNTNATAIYGGKGKNGVIIVTTKRNVPSTVELAPQNDIETTIQGGLSPNGDGINDYLIIKTDKKIELIEVYDKFGKMVYRKENYQNDWNGKANIGNSDIVSDGTYYFLVKLNGEEKNRYGNISVHR